MAARGASGARRIVLNRAAFDAITLAVADGAFELAKKIIDGARPPDYPIDVWVKSGPHAGEQRAFRTGEGLPKHAGVLAYVGSKRVGVYSKRGATSVSKPKAAKLSKGVTVIGGFGFPGRFVEEGTVHMGAQPFLTPELMADLPDAEGFIKAACIKHKVIGAARAAKGDTFGASKARQAAKAGIG